MFPIEGPLIADATRDLAHSALPDAPVVPDEEPRVRRSRQTLARTLRSLADRIEPSRRVDPALRPHPQ
ncbi:hypothetical protein K378_05295 [Streptomyces sp. Amel2xB2]|uniref:Uncharacterized protein n=1 Tax=Streptomyces nanshensis TaxID=518642 RepID=A0A1E7KQY4_9ACTN|nr:MULTISPECIES: hypothetical protein [Streptomyces]OEV06271.1 hypothetical protein AN218_30815 [Streptomyces nanshensis]RAJ57408.1 hypothetical protein K378_05295 [Streptomyces sp. Amel2xB2]